MTLQIASPLQVRSLLLLPAKLKFKTWPTLQGGNSCLNRYPKAPRSNRCRPTRRFGQKKRKKGQRALSQSTPAPKSTGTHTSHTDAIVIPLLGCAKAGAPPPPGGPHGLPAPRVFAKFQLIPDAVPDALDIAAMNRAASRTPMHIRA